LVIDQNGPVKTGAVFTATYWKIEYRMTSVCLYFKVHQPFRLKAYSSSGIDVDHSYFNGDADEDAINILADNCYLPANEIIYQQILAQRGKFRVSYSISGTIIELLQQYRPDVIASFRRLTETGYIDILGETYYHSLSSLHSKKEWERQVFMHSGKVKDVFEITTSVFRNTELIHSNSIATRVRELGFKAIFCEGVERILKGRSPNHPYTSPGNNSIPLLLRNARLSDDIAFRFDDQSWSEHPLTADKFAAWLHSHPEHTEVINLFMDYETFGIHKKPESGIFDFLQALPALVSKKSSFVFATPAQVLENYTAKDVYDVRETISWEDQPETSCVWSENVMQHSTLRKIHSLEKLVREANCKQLTDTWGRLQSADHFYYMSEDAINNYPHKYRNPFSSSQEAFQNYANIVADFEITLIKKGLAHVKKHTSLRTVAMNFF
jgi:alpha-amylase